MVPGTLSTETSGSQFSVASMEAFGLWVEHRPAGSWQWDLVSVQMLNCCILLFILPFSFSRGKPAPPENFEYSNAFCLGLAVSQPANLLGNDRDNALCTLYMPHSRSVPDLESSCNNTSALKGMLPSPAPLPPVHILLSSHCQAPSLYVVLPHIPCSLWLSQNVVSS